ncbi:MAG: hypothetical protein GY858_05440 [Candidatus Omnitrophica bacterium]|nr:hypothetical protein [Candidatus Omnitrophota bacterium]
MPQEAKESYLTMAMYYEDTLTADGIVASDASANTNKGLKKRAKFFEKSNEVEMIDTLHICCHSADRLLLPNMQMDYMLTLQNQDFFLMNPANDPTKYKFHITSASLLVARVDVSPSLQIAHASLLMQNNAKYYMHRVQPCDFTIPSGALQFSVVDLFTGFEMPTQLVLLFVRTKARLGDMKLNPFFLQNLKISTLNLFVGARRIPTSEYDMDVSKDRSLLLFLQSQGALNYMKSNMGPGNIDRKSFQDAAFLCVFDLSRGKFWYE